MLRSTPTPTSPPPWAATAGSPVPGEGLAVRAVDVTPSFVVIHLDVTDHPEIADLPRVIADDGRSHVEHRWRCVGGSDPASWTIRCDVTVSAPVRCDFAVEFAFWPDAALVIAAGASVTLALRRSGHPGVQALRLGIATDGDLGAWVPTFTAAIGA